MEKVKRFEYFLKALYITPTLHTDLMLFSQTNAISVIQKWVAFGIFKCPIDQRFWTDVTDLEYCAVEWKAKKKKEHSVFLVCFLSFVMSNRR